MSLQTKSIPRFISPLHLCTPSRIAGERKLASLLNNIKNPESVSNVLDVGCGSGEFRFLFPGCFYTGIDIRDYQYADKKGTEHFFLIGDGVRLPVRSNSQDLVYSSYAFEYFSDPKEALSEMHRVLRPGGLVVICLPTRWVAAYDFLSDLLRKAGFDIGQVSAQPGIRYYYPRSLQNLAEDANFLKVRIFPVYGWPVLVLKTFLSWNRVVMHVLMRLAKKLSKGRINRKLPLYIPRAVTSAKNYQDWQQILRRKLADCPPMGHMFLMLVNFATKLDNLTGSRPIVEYIVLFVKPTDS